MGNDREDIASGNPELLLPRPKQRLSYRDRGKMDGGPSVGRDEKTQRSGTIARMQETTLIRVREVFQTRGEDRKQPMSSITKKEGKKTRGQKTK